MNNPMMGFIQGFWIRAQGTETPSMHFTAAKPIYGVLRDRLDGRPLKMSPVTSAEATPGDWVLKFPDLREAPGQEALLYLFESSDAARSYQDACAKPWDRVKLLSLLDEKWLPDINHQQALPLIVQGSSPAAMPSSASARTSGGSSVTLVLDQGTTVQMAAPGNPPKWIP